MEKQENKSIYLYLTKLLTSLIEKQKRLNPTMEYVNKAGKISPATYSTWALGHQQELEKLIRVNDKHDITTVYAIELCKKLEKFKKSCYKWKPIYIDDNFMIMNDTVAQMDAWGLSIEILDSIYKNLQEFINDNRYLAWQIEDKSIFFQNDRKED